jgi:hypothetical protein
MNYHVEAGLSIVAGYLPYIDNISISFTCKNLYLFIKKNRPSFADIVKKELGKYLNNEQLVEFFKLMKENKVVISGSFVLAMIFGESWYNDIDIYENIHHSHKLLNTETINNFINDDGYAKIDEMIKEHSSFSYFKGLEGTIAFIKEYDLTQLTNFLWKNKDDYDYETQAFTRRVRYFELRNKNYPEILDVHPLRNYGMIIRQHVNFQHIPIRCDPKELINKSFDTNILKNIFDGENLYVWSWDLLRSKKDYMKSSGVVYHNYCRFARVQKTMDQKLHMKGEYMNHFNEFDKKTEKRIQKYQNRGFSLVRHPRYKEIVHHLKKTHYVI